MSGNTNSKGGASEARFVVAAFDRGWDIAQPFGHSQPYDFVVRRTGNRWETVQVKSAYAGCDGRKNPNRTVSLRRCNEKGARPYSDGDFDVLCVVDDADIWLFPWSEIRHIRSQLVVSSPKYNDYKL